LRQEVEVAKERADAALGELREELGAAEDRAAAADEIAAQMAAAAAASADQLSRMGLVLAENTAAADERADADADRARQEVAAAEEVATEVNARMAQIAGETLHDVAAALLRASAAEEAATEYEEQVRLMERQRDAAAIDSELRAEHAMESGRAAGARDLD